MNLDKAYESWGQMSDNRELYYKTKTLFRKIWWLIPTNKPCSYYTLDVLGRALVQANGAQSDKVKAASVMVHVLTFAHNTNPDENPKPTFGYQDIVNFEGTKPSKMVQTIESARGQVPGSKQTSAEGDARDLSPDIDEAAANTQQPTPITQSEAPLVKVKPAAKAAVKREKNDAGIGSSEREQARRDNGKAKREGELARRTGTPPKSVVQLDAETLKPIKVWKSCNAAQNGLGIKNVQRAISRCGISGGFYWCRPGDEETFKPMDKRANNRVPKAASKREKNDACISSSEREQTRRDNGKPLTPEQKQLHKKVFDAPTRQQPKTLQEAHDNLQQAINEHVDEVLRGCTQDELIAELRRRSWKGILHITQTIEL